MKTPYGESNFKKVISQGFIYIDKVTAQQQRKFELDKDFNRDAFISLLAYMGFVTIAGSTLTQTVFAIPNHVIHELYIAALPKLSVWVVLTNGEQVEVVKEK